MRLPRRDASSPVALAALVGANVVPLVGVVWWGWRPLDVLVLYWLESGVVGALNVPKILLADGEPDDDSNVTVRINGVPLDAIESRPDARVSLAGFFVMHYGIFWVVHGAFVLFAFGAFAGSPGEVGASLPFIGLGVVSMVASHGVSFGVNYLGGKEFRDVSPGRQMMRPYGRVVVLHVTIVLGAFAVGALGSGVGPLVLLVALKTALDLVAHLREHDAAEPSRPEPTETA